MKALRRLLSKVFWVKYVILAFFTLYFTAFVFLASAQESGGGGAGGSWGNPPETNSQCYIRTHLKSVVNAINPVVNVYGGNYQFYNQTDCTDRWAAGSASFRYQSDSSGTITEWGTAFCYAVDQTAFESPVCPSPSPPPLECETNPYTLECGQYCELYSWTTFCQDNLPPPPECESDPGSTTCIDFCTAFPEYCTEVPPPPPDSCEIDPYGLGCQSYCDQYPDVAICQNIDPPLPPPDSCSTNPFSQECQNYCSIYPSQCPTPPPADDNGFGGGESGAAGAGNDFPESDPPVQCGLAPLPPCEIEINDLPPVEIELPPPPELLPLPEPDQDSCIDCQSEGWENNQNFLAYALTVFSTKFPFDALGTPSTSVDVCPVLEIYTKTFKLCFINEAIAALKYPVWIIWLLKLIIH